MVDVHAYREVLLAYHRQIRLPAWMRRIRRALAVRRRFNRRQWRRRGGREASLSWMLALPQSRGNG